MSEQSVESTPTVKKVIMADLEKWLSDNKIDLKPYLLKRFCECKRLIDVKRVISLAESRANLSTSDYEFKILPRSIYWRDVSFLMNEGLDELERINYKNEAELVGKFCEDYIEDKAEEHSDEENSEEYYYSDEDEDEKSLE